MSAGTLLKCIELYVDHLCTSQYACDTSLKHLQTEQRDAPPPPAYGLLYSAIFFNKGEIMIFLFILE